MRWLAVFILAGVLPVDSQPQGKQANRERIQVMEVSAGRSDGKITVDGRVKNTGERALAKVVLVFDLLDSDRKVIAQRKGQLEEELLPPGEEAPFHFYVPDQARAIHVRLGAQTAKQDYLEVVNRGPFPIE